ncbi:MAG: ThuA domain-containing protein, partial [Ferruginibacter sp.]|nr:ThuA domain-containing protein [Chitinophagaceae bacterium]
QTITGIVNPRSEKNKKQVSVLIIDGFSNHDWKETTREIKDILEETGMFKVDVSTSPSAVEDAAWVNWDPSFKNYDVVIQNSNNYSNKNLKWPERIEAQLEKYVRSGGGLYILHSANNSFPHWAAYDKMIGLGWRPKETGFALELDSENNILRIPPGQGDKTSHGKRFDATIKILTRHPVNKDFPGEWITPSMELYTHPRGPAENITVLSYAADSATKRKWPVEWLVKYGKGDVYNSSMGHLWKDEVYPVSYRCIGFQTILIRMVEWLATGKTTFPLPANFPTGISMSVRAEKDYPVTVQ